MRWCNKWNVNTRIFILNCQFIRTFVTLDITLALNYPSCSILWLILYRDNMTTFSQIYFTHLYWKHIRTSQVQKVIIYLLPENLSEAIRVVLTIINRYDMIYILLNTGSRICISLPVFFNNGFRLHGWVGCNPSAISVPRNDSSLEFKVKGDSQIIIIPTFLCIHREFSLRLIKSKPLPVGSFFFLETVF